MAIKHDTLTLGDLLHLESAQKLVLPNFQRDFVWKPDQQRNLLCSLLAGVPIGSVLLLQGKSSDYSSRPLCFNRDATPLSECKYLLDGQQRLSTLKHIFADSFNGSWSEAWRDLFSKLRYRWFICINPDTTTNEDIFGYKRLIFNPELEPYEPADFRPFAVEKKILKSGQSQWYHPAWKSNNDSESLVGERLRLEIARSAAKEYLVPLWEIWKDKRDGLHQKTLQLIAKERIDNIRAEIKDGKRNLINVLSPVAPDIETAVKSGDSDVINDAWKDLEFRWASDVSLFLIERLKENIPVIDLPANEIGRGIAIFETINRGGTALSTFDLVVARMARTRTTNESLTAVIANTLSQPLDISDSLFQGNKGKKPTDWHPDLMDVVVDMAPSQIFKNFFLNLLSIANFRENRNGSLSELKVDQIKKTKILRLSGDEIANSCQLVTQILAKTLAFLQFRCGIIKDDDLKYKLMVLPIAAALLDSSAWESSASLNRIEYWYWASLFSGAYRERQNEQCIRDVIELVDWVSGRKQNPFKSRETGVFLEKNYSDADTILRKRTDDEVSSDVEDCVLQYILSQQPHDFIEDNRMSTWDIATDTSQYQVHHILPLANAAGVGRSTKELRKQKEHILNSSINKTYILAKTNNAISSKSIQDYYDILKQKTKHDHALTGWSVGFVPRQTEETNDSYYLRLLARRFDEIKNTVSKELDHLVGE
jgi:hypothetical protein